MSPAKRFFGQRRFSPQATRLPSASPRTDKSPLKKLGWRPHLVLEATAGTADGEVAYFQKSIFPR
jgi:hypothetical protein